MTAKAARDFTSSTSYGEDNDGETSAAADGKDGGGNSGGVDGDDGYEGDDGDDGDDGVKDMLTTPMSRAATLYLSTSFRATVDNDDEGLRCFSTFERRRPYHAT